MPHRIEGSTGRRGGGEQGGGAGEAQGGVGSFGRSIASALAVVRPTRAATLLVHSLSRGSKRPDHLPFPPFLSLPPTLSRLRLTSRHPRPPSASLAPGLALSAQRIDPRLSSSADPHPPHPHHTRSPPSSPPLLPMSHANQQGGPPVLAPVINVTTSADGVPRSALRFLSWFTLSALSSTKSPSPPALAGGARASDVLGPTLPPTRSFFHRILLWHPSSARALHSCVRRRRQPRTPPPVRAAAGPGSPARGLIHA